MYRMMLSERNVRAITEMVCELRAELVEVRSILAAYQISEAKGEGVWDFLKAITPYIILVAGWVASGLMGVT